MAQEQLRPPVVDSLFIAAAKYVRSCLYEVIVQNGAIVLHEAYGERHRAAKFEKWDLVSKAWNDVAAVAFSKTNTVAGLVTTESALTLARHKFVAQVQQGAVSGDNLDCCNYLFPRLSFAIDLCANSFTILEEETGDFVHRVSVRLWLPEEQGEVSSTIVQARNVAELIILCYRKINEALRTVPTQYFTTFVASDSINGAIGIYDAQQCYMVRRGKIVDTPSLGAMYG